jgi:hypothetical protein
LPSWTWTRPGRSKPPRSSALTTWHRLRADLTSCREAAELAIADNRHRGKGQQKVTVEHVHVHSGGQAIVGAVETSGGVASENQGHADAKAITHAPVAPLWREDQERQAGPLAGHAEREVSPSRRGVAAS